MRTQNCPVCKLEFKVAGNSKRTYCSKACMKAGYSSRMSGIGNPNFRHGRKQCDGCRRVLSRNTRGTRCRNCGAYAGKENGFFGRRHSGETRSKMVVNHADFSGIRNPFFGNDHTTEVRQKIGSKALSRWNAASEDQRDKVKQDLLKGLSTQRSGLMTTPERIVAKELESIGLRFRHNAEMYGKFLVDFLLDDGTIIEVFGDYWHSNPNLFPSPSKTQLKQMARDKSRIAYLRKCGHIVIVFWEADLKRDKTVVGKVVTEVVPEAIIGITHKDWDSCCI